MIEQKGRPDAGNELGKFIDARMTELGLTQRQVADIVGFKNRNMLSFIKNGDGKLPLERVAGMARAIKVPASELFEMALKQHFSEETIAVMKEALVESALSQTEKMLVDLFRAVRTGDNLDADVLRTMANIIEEKGVTESVEGARKFLAEKAKGARSRAKDDPEPDEAN